MLPTRPTLTVAGEVADLTHVTDPPYVALKRAGAQVTRDGLLAALEGLRDFDAGAGPALSFGKNRRTGVMGASVLQLDPERRDVARASAWIEVVQ